MSNPKNPISMLDMFQHPVFCVKDGFIQALNDRAVACGFAVQTPIAELLCCDEDIYTLSAGDCLCTGVQTANIRYIATVIPTDDGDYFHLQVANPGSEVRTMALVAQQLRAPLSEIMTATEAILGTEGTQNADECHLIYKNLLRMMREVSNMSAFASYQQDRLYGKQTANIVSVINEVLEKAQNLCNSSVQQLHYIPYAEDIYCPTDTEMLERAIYNLISNAIKFSPEGSVAKAKLSAENNKVYFSIQSKLSDPTLTKGNLFLRYLRDAAIEDGRYGIGLGIPLTQYAAVAHNGALLMDYPEADVVRFTLILSAVPSKEILLKAPFPAFDYTGGWDHGLVELSDILPLSAFKTK